MITAQKIGEMGSNAEGTAEDDESTLAGMNKRIKMPSSVASRSSRGSVGSKSRN